ncbi:type II CAAX prenyl endopeptidase Rce1 family protein [Bacteroidota bacterium]
MKLDKKKWIELLAVAITGLLKFIIMDWLQMRAFYIVGVCIFWLIYLYVNYKNDHTLLKHWGFQKNNFKKSFFFILPIAIVTIILIVLYGLLNNTVIINRNIILIFLLYPVFGLIQQFMMIGLIAGNLIAIEKIRFKNYQVVILTSLVFSLVHYPSFFLMIFTFFLELIFTSVYLKWRNLWSLGLYHGWIATFLLFYVLERDLWTELFAWF